MATVDVAVFKESDKGLTRDWSLFEKMSSTRRGNKVKAIFVSDDMFQNNKYLKLIGVWGMSKDGIEFFLVPNVTVDGD